MSILTPVPVPFLFNAVVVSWHDGDTGLFEVDRGDRDYSMWTIRLDGCALLELGEPGGVESRDELTRRLPAGTPVVLATVKPDKYGNRKDARVIYRGADGHSRDLSLDLITDGWAMPWDGTGKQPKIKWPRSS